MKDNVTKLYIHRTITGTFTILLLTIVFFLFDTTRQVSIVFGIAGYVFNFYMYYKYRLETIRNED